MADDTLFRCPFCGGPAAFEEITTDIYPTYTTWSVGCANGDEDCIGYQMLARYSRKCEAAEAWNKRAKKTDATTAPVRGPDRACCERQPRKDCDVPGCTMKEAKWALPVAQVIPTPAQPTPAPWARDVFLKVLRQYGSEPYSHVAINAAWEAALGVQHPSAPVDILGLTIDAIYKQALRMHPSDQHKLAEMIAANVGYELTPEPPHPDCPHSRSSAATGDDHCPTCDLTHEEHEKIIHKWCKDPFHQRATDIGKQRIRKFVVCGDCGLEEHCGERCPNAEISGQEG